MPGQAMGRVAEDGGGAAARQTGRLLQAVRARAGLSQRQVADRVATSQSWVSRVERGAVHLRLGDAERLFAAVGARIVVQTATLGDAAPDPDLVPDGGLAEAREDAAATFRYVLRKSGAVPHVVGGRLAALAQALPVVPDRIDLIVSTADVAAVHDIMALLALRRWSERWQEFRDFDIAPDGPAPRRWSVAGLTELRLELVDELPAALVVEFDGSPLRVLPLPELLRTDDDVASLAARLNGR